VKAQGFEGLVAKRRNSKYESGVRTGAWQKMCVNGDMGWWLVATQRERRPSTRSCSDITRATSWRAQVTSTEQSRRGVRCRDDDSALV